MGSPAVGAVLSIMLSVCLILGGVLLILYLHCAWRARQNPQVAAALAAQDSVHLLTSVGITRLSRGYGGTAGADYLHITLQDGSSFQIGKQPVWSAEDGAERRYLILIRTGDIYYAGTAPAPDETKAEFMAKILADIETASSAVIKRNTALQTWR